MNNAIDCIKLSVYLFYWRGVLKDLCCCPSLSLSKPHITPKAHLSFFIISINGFTTRISAYLCMQILFKSRYKVSSYTAAWKVNLRKKADYDMMTMMMTTRKTTFSFIWPTFLLKNTDGQWKRFYTCHVRQTKPVLHFSHSIRKRKTFIIKAI